MMSYDVDPAASEPHSIAPMAYDTNEWKIDLNNLHSGVRFDFSVPTHDDDGVDVGLPARPRRTAGRRVLAVMSTVMLVAGLGFVAFRARPLFQHATASSRVAQTIAKPAPVVAVTPVTPVTPAPPAPIAQAVAVATPEPPVVAAKPAKGKAAKAAGIPTFSASDLPNAPKAKRGVKRSAK